MDALAQDGSPDLHIFAHQHILHQDGPLYAAVSPDAHRSANHGMVRQDGAIRNFSVAANVTRRHDHAALG